MGDRADSPGFQPGQPGSSPGCGTNGRTSRQTATAPALNAGEAKALASSTLAPSARSITWRSKPIAGDGTRFEGGRASGPCGFDPRLLRHAPRCFTKVPVPGQSFHSCFLDVEEIVSREATRIRESGVGFRGQGSASGVRASLLASTRRTIVRVEKSRDQKANSEALTPVDNPGVASET